MKFTQAHVLLKTILKQNSELLLVASLLSNVVSET